MIEIVPYQDRWVSEFRRLENDIRQAAGRLAVRVDHIGSTSVTGLDAKDILDVMVSVRSLDAADELVEPLSGLDFQLISGVRSDHPPAGIDTVPVEWAKRLFNRYPPARRVHLHVRVDGRANQRYALLFRDYLRAQPRAAAGYAALKHQLARYHGHTDDHTAYVEIKDPVCDIIMAAAEDGAADRLDSEINVHCRRNQ